MSLIEAVILAGSNDSGLSEDSRKLVAEHVSGPIDIKVFVTPTCPHCPRAVTLAHKLAVESPHIRAACVEATEFMDLSRKYRVTGVPKTIVNETVEILGAVPEDAFVRSVVMPPGSGEDVTRGVVGLRASASRLGARVRSGAGPQTRARRPEHAETAHGYRPVVPTGLPQYRNVVPGTPASPYFSRYSCDRQNLIDRRIES